MPASPNPPPPADREEDAAPVPPPDPVSDEDRERINRILRGDVGALAELFAMYRPRLWRMVNLRLHPRLRGRVDPDDVLQDAWLRAVDRLPHFLRDASRSSFIWFRMIVVQTLTDLHRHHLGADKRSATRERSLQSHWDAGSTSHSMAIHLVGHISTPSHIAARAELADQLDKAIQGMDDIDQEVLALRHFEELTNGDTARVLGLSEQAASIRYIRALKRLRGILNVFPAFKSAGWGDVPADPPDGAK